ncbi:hypothetical protein K2F54_15360 [Cryobacterium sp. 1639]|uniref:macro domain-containing protein n=1 Tax=Cryobacterium inferilacus TaxID=2866629 RepID=UPI001C737484|nr:macro domain-containing protein [Cryobacterium sp. 1639]MBX0301351.1 hypothetical protein [Cryobacterium sp. 1639]
MLAYARQLKYPRFWKDFFRTWLASIGAFALIVGLLAVFFPDFFIGNVLIVLIVVGGSGVAAIVLSRPVIPFNEYVSDRAKIRLVVGDLFAQPGNSLIGVTTTFDVTTSDGIIAKSSVQGALLATVFDGSEARMGKAMDDALLPHTPLRSIHKPGRTNAYEVGTVASLSATNGTRYFCVAYTEMDTHNNAHGSIENVEKALQATWDEVDRTTNGERINVPLIGQGQSRIAGLTPEVVVRLIAISFLLRTRRSFFSKELCIAIHPSDAGKINMREFHAFLVQLGTT